MDSAARVRGGQVVETDATDDDGEPAAKVVDLVDIGSSKTAERLLDYVLGVGSTVQHPRCETEEVGMLIAPRVVDAPLGVGGRCVVVIHGCAPDETVLVAGRTKEAAEM